MLSPPTTNAGRLSPVTRTRDHQPHADDSRRDSAFGTARTDGRDSGYFVAVRAVEVAATSVECDDDLAGYLARLEQPMRLADLLEWKPRADERVEPSGAELLRSSERVVHVAEP